MATDPKAPFSRHDAQALLRSVAPLPHADARAVLEQAAKKGPLAPVVDLTQASRPGEIAQQAGQSVAPFGAGLHAPALVHEPGGDVLRELQHPEFVTFEELYRVLPDDSWFQPTVSPNTPIQFELGSFTVPQGQQLWVFDYEFSLYRLAGMDAGDFVRLEAGRMSGVLGFDITVNGRRPSHLLYQLDPVPVQVTRQSFQPQGQSTNAQFVRSSSNSFAANASPGLSLLPVRRAMQGAQGKPFTFIARQGDKVSLSCVIFDRVKTPIAAMEARHAGYLIQTNQADALIERMRPR